MDEIDIKLNSKWDGSGADKATKSMQGLGQAAAKLGEAIGGANTYLGQFVNFFTKGSIWEMAATLVGYGIRKVQEWLKASENAQKEAARAAKEAHDAQMKCIDEYSAAMQRVAQERSAIINHNLKMLNDEVEATKELTKATLELQKAEARRKGDDSAVAAIQTQIDRVDAEAAANRIMNEMDAARARKEADQANLANITKSRDEASKVVQAAEKNIAAEIERVRRVAAASAVGSMVLSGVGGGISRLPATEQERLEAANRAEAEFRKGGDFKQLTDRLTDAQQKVSGFEEQMRAAQRAIEAAAEDEENLGRRADALLLRDTAKRVNAEADVAAAKVKQIEAVKQAEMKAAAEIAKAQQQHDLERHQRRVAQLREEIADAGKRAGGLRSLAAASQSEFDRAFAMYRDPAQAAAIIGEEKDYQNDLKRLHRDANRYGGKWRIDELSRLMAAGDSQGVTDTLTQWRRNGRFTPQIEAMVRASAAERTKTTAEEELRKIEHNTANLAQQMKELIGMKG